MLFANGLLKRHSSGFLRSTKLSCCQIHLIACVDVRAVIYTTLTCNEVVVLLAFLL